MLIAAPDHVLAIQSAAWRADPYPLFAELRDRLPVARLDWPAHGAGDWLVTRHADVVAALRHPLLVVSRTGGVPALRTAPGQRTADPNEPLQHTVLTTDGDDYLPLRTRTARATAALTPAAEQRVIAHVARIARDLRARRRCDLVGDFAQPVCEAIWSDLMAIDIAGVRRLSVLSAAYLEQGFIFGHGPVKESARAAIAGMRDMLRTTLAANAARDDIGFLRSVATDFGRSREDAISVTNTAVLLTAAMLQTTRHAIVNCLAALIARPDDWRLLRDQPALVPQAIEECLRFDGPSQAVGRVATQALCLGGRKIPRGAFIRLAVASANRDGARHPAADRIDLHRPPLPHLAFGRALHSCSGARLARLVLRHSLRAFGQAFAHPMIEPAGIVRETESSLRGYRRLCVTLAG